VRCAGGDRCTVNWSVRAATLRSSPAPDPSDAVPPLIKPLHANLRVIKKIAPNQRGAKSLSVEFGDRLVCVRHRIDATGTKRLVSVELTVSEKVIARRPGPTVDVALKVYEKDIQAKLKAVGARWDASAEVWSVRRSTAIALGLKQRIVPRLP